MPRRKKIESYVRDVGVDERYNSPLIQKFINVVMWRGKKSIARTIVYEAMDELIKKTGSKEKGLQFFYTAFEQLIPQIEVRPRRVGGSVYQIPVEVRSDRARALAMRWLISASSSRSDKSMGKRIAHELMDAAEGRGAAFKKKLDVHRMAEANRAFAHYAW